MAVTIKGQRWKVYAYADYTAYVLADGEHGVFSGIPNFEAPNVEVCGDGTHTVSELVAMRQSRPVYAYDDVDTDIPESGTQVALTDAPNTELYIMVVTGDGAHTFAELVANFNANLESIADIAIAGYVEVTANYEVLASDRSLVVTTADAVTITIPEGLSIGTDLKISRTVASTNAVTVATTGSDTIEGGSTFITHGAFASSTLNDAEVVIKKKSATLWKFVNGEISGSNENGSWKKSADGTLIQCGSWTGGSDGTVSNFFSSSSGTSYLRDSTQIFPIDFYSDIGLILNVSGETFCGFQESLLTNHQFRSYKIYGSDPDTYTLYWIAIGKWKE